MKIVLSLFSGILLIVAGTAVLINHGLTVTLAEGTALLSYRAINVASAERALVSLGPANVGFQEVNWTAALPPVLGAVLLAAGAAMVFLIALVKRGHGSAGRPKALAEPR